MSAWEIQACLDGYSEAHGGKSKKPTSDVSEERLRQMGIEGF